LRARLGWTSALLLALGMGLLPAAAAGRPPIVRTGGPSAPRERKIAIVAGRPALAGSRFRVYRGGRLVMGGRLQSAAGSPAPWRAAFRADLSRVRRPGVYEIRVGGARPRRWRVSERGSSGLVPLILGFFRANRDGDEASPLHGPSHLNDATVEGGAYDGVRFDLTGGWMDAGDMLHFTQTTAYATTVLEAAARLDPAHRSALEGEAAVGVRWLLEAHPVPRLFVTQVGDNRDHERPFGDPALDDHSQLPGIGHRPAYHWRQGVGGDIGGKVAAALALAAERSPPWVRTPLLQAASEWYEAGRAAGRATPPLPHAGGFYVIARWQDSLAAGAAALYRATGDPSYLRQAEEYLAESKAAATLGWSNMAPLAAADICGRLGAPGLGTAEERRPACRFLLRSAGAAISRSRRNAFAPCGPFSWGTTSSIAAGGAIAALSRLPRGRGCAAGARDYLLGRNPWGTSFVAGAGPHSPRHVSSWASVFGPGLPRGAVVGGPAPRKVVLAQGFHLHGPLRRFDSRFVYQDRRSDYVTSEPALDYAANAILLLAALGSN
jgi:endoglucanase